MEQIKTLYYERFLQHVVSEYSDKIKNAKPGHCMKITGLAMKELKVLLPQVRALNPKMASFILSETDRGNDFICATKLIELRNDANKIVLVLVPSNSRTSAEDSYGDATFQNLAVSTLQTSFLNALIGDIPQSLEYRWKQMNDFQKEIGTARSAKINYLLYLELHHYSDESWGNGLYLMGMLPDSGLVKDDSNMHRRFYINHDKISSVIADFSMTASDRIANLPLKKDTRQKDLMRFLSDDNVANDAVSLFEKIHDKYKFLNYAEMPWIMPGDGGKVKVCVNLAPGKDSTKELIKEKSTGDFLLKIPDERKGKISFKITIDPSPKENTDIDAFNITLVNMDNYEESAVVKKAKIGTNKGATRRLTLNIPNGLFDDGEYMVCARAVDKNGITLNHDIVFKETRVEEAWLDAYEKNPSLQRDQYRLDQKVAYCNESEVFTLLSSDEPFESSEIDKRAKVNSIVQAITSYRSSHLIKDESLEMPDEGDDSRHWVEGMLNSAYHFDFGPAYAYQIQLSNKLIQLEKTFLSNSDKIGHVEAYLSGNPTDSVLLDPTDTANNNPRFVNIENTNIPKDLLLLRIEVFSLIKESAGNGSGLTCTFDITQNIGKVRSYVSEYTQWLHDILENELDERTLVEIQNIDTVMLRTEMPDGNTTDLKLITPLHPLRLAWLVNLYELYQDWEEKTFNNQKYKKAWYRKLDKLFQGQLPLDISPLVLCDNTLKEAYQYIGEITYGWGAYARPSYGQKESFASGYRQLKSYTSVLLNVEREKRIDSDVNLDLVVRHISNYGQSHPYTDKLVINLFNAGDASVFAQALVELEKRGFGKGLSYEIRLFSDDELLRSGEAFKNLLDPDMINDPEAEVFSQASLNRLFPKLRFSINKISDFTDRHDHYQAHISFLVNPFSVKTELVKQNELSRSFFMNGTICRSVVNSTQEGKSYVWNRYFSNKTLPDPISEFANMEVSLFARLQETTGKLLSSTLKESVPATTLRLKESDMMLLSFVHDSSDWVVTFDKNMGPEFYDLPCDNNNDIPYLLDYVPSDNTSGISSYLTTRPTSEISSLMIPLFKRYDIDLEKHENFMQILEDVRSVSSSLIMQVNATSRKGFEVIGTTLAKRFLEKKGITKESFMIPIDLHQELFVDLDNDNKERADNIVVKIDTDKKEILFNVVEIKCRNAGYDAEELHHKMIDQIENTIFALRSHFEKAPDGYDRLDRELKILELKSLLEFYVRRSMRYKQLNPNISHRYLKFLSKLSDGYEVRFKRLGIIFDFLQVERQKKSYYDDTLIYTMGKPAIDEILDNKSSLDTITLEAMDKDIVSFFEPTINEQYYNNEEDEVDFENQEVVENQNDDVEVVIENDIVNYAEKEENNDSNSSVESVKSVIFDSIKDEPSENSHDDPNYIEPKYDILIGKNDDSPQFGILGKTTSNGRLIGIDLNECNTISLFGVQGAGKSYTIGSITEMVLRQFSNVNKLPAPMASVIFHYSDSLDYAPEFTSMVYPNDEARQLAKLKAEYGAEPGAIKDVVLLAPSDKVELRKKEYPDVEVHPIGFDSGELMVKDWMFLLGAMGNDSTYIRELKQIMKSCRNNMSLKNIRECVANNNHFSSTQRSLAVQKLDFAEEYITDGVKLQQYLHPGRLIIVDLRDEFIEKDEALGLFVVMLSIFSNVKAEDGSMFNKFIVFDEAHKYMNDRELVESITTAIREMRHKGTSIMIASQDPMSLPTEIIELSSIVVMHKFSSPAWVKHVQKAITPLQTLTATEMSSLGSGEAYLWANKATDKSVTQHPIKISIRPRVTKHGGDTIKAVK